MWYSLHTNDMSWWLPIVGQNGVGRVTQPDEPLRPSVHMDVPSSVALHPHAWQYCRMLRLANVQARTAYCAGMNIMGVVKQTRHNERLGVVL